MQAAEQDKQEEQAKAAQLKKVSCRLCKGDHFTSKCPYRQELEMVGIRGGKAQLLFILPPFSIVDNRPDAPPSDDLPPTDTPAAGSGTGKYVPPSMRGGVVRAGESMNRPREDLPTLRVTNVSEDATEDDLRDLFSRFGRVHRVYIGRDRETGIGKGYAFVSFEDRTVAEKAMHRIHGMGAYFATSTIVPYSRTRFLGYDNLILNCQWSRKSCFYFRYPSNNEISVTEPRETRNAP